jgi:maltose O-acetyltransferase
MLAGELYRGSDPGLAVERRRARELLGRLNASGPEERPAIARELFAVFGDDAWLETPFQCDYGWNVRIGAGAFLNFGCVILDCAPVEIGEITEVGPGVHVYAATHPTDPELRRQRLELARPVTIGRNVWIGGGAIVGPGVTVGDDSVIGAGSVVVRDVPAGVVVAGNPARVVREL